VPRAAPAAARSCRCRRYRGRRQFGGAPAPTATVDVPAPTRLPNSDTDRPAHRWTDSALREASPPASAAVRPGPSWDGIAFGSCTYSRSSPAFWPRIRRAQAAGLAIPGGHPYLNHGETYAQLSA
jgi:hypothetical protein